MAIFDAFKNFLSPVTLEIEVQGSFSARDSSIDGQIKLSAQGAQQVREVAIILIERLQLEGGGERDEIMGKAMVCAQTFSLADKETVALPFSIPIDFPKGNWESVIEVGGVLGVLGKVASAMSDAPDSSVSYELVAAADVLGCKFDPKITRRITRWDWRSK